MPEGEEVINATLETINWSYVGAAILAITMGLLLLLILLPRLKANLWTGIALGGVAAGGMVIAQNYTRLWDWIALGLSGDNGGATLFVIGMILMIAVMAYNLIMTKGATAVR